MCQETWTRICQRAPGLRSDATQQAQGECPETPDRGVRPTVLASVQGEVHMEGLEHCPRIVVHAWLRPCAWSDVWNTNRVSRCTSSTRRPVDCVIPLALLAYLLK